MTAAGCSMAGERRLRLLRWCRVSRHFVCGRRRARCGLELAAFASCQEAWLPAHVAVVAFVLGHNAVRPRVGLRAATMGNRPAQSKQDATPHAEDHPSCTLVGRSSRRRCKGWEEERMRKG